MARNEAAVHSRDNCEHQPGRPRTLPDDVLMMMTQKTLETRPSDGRTHWTCRAMADNVPPDLDVHLVVDNHGAHKHARVQRWLAARPRCHLHFTPTYTSWLNQVEIWFHLITQKAFRRGSFASVTWLKEKILRFTDHYNPGARPFLWTATADSILHKIQRLCTAISGTQR